MAGEHRLPGMSKTETDDDTDDAALRAQYAWLIALIRDLELIEPAPGWEERAMERWRAANRGADPAAKLR
jgi:hypothetical protein